MGRGIRIVLTAFGLLGCGREEPEGVRTAPVTGVEAPGSGVAEAPHAGPTRTIPMH